jgi:hypothetical protein
MTLKPRVDAATLHQYNAIRYVNWTSYYGAWFAPNRAPTYPYGGLGASTDGRSSILFPAHHFAFGKEQLPPLLGDLPERFSYHTVDLLGQNT